MFLSTSSVSHVMSIAHRANLPVKAIIVRYLENDRVYKVSFNELKSETNFKNSRRAAKLRAKRVQENGFKFCFLQWKINQVYSLYLEVPCRPIPAPRNDFLTLSTETDECFDGL